MKNMPSRSGMWPYICMADCFNQIWVFCAFDHTVMKRIIMPYSVKNACIDEVFITNEFDLFVLVNHFRYKEYELMQIDLDMPRGFTDYKDQTLSLKSLFKYDYETVNSRPVLDIMVRSASKDNP